MRNAIASLCIIINKCLVRIYICASRISPYITPCIIFIYIEISRHFNMGYLKLRDFLLMIFLVSGRLSVFPGRDVPPQPWPAAMWYYILHYFSAQGRRFISALLIKSDRAEDCNELISIDIFHDDFAYFILALQSREALR